MPHTKFKSSADGSFRYETTEPTEGNNKGVCVVSDLSNNQHVLTASTKSWTSLDAIYQGHPTNNKSEAIGHKDPRHKGEWHCNNDPYFDKDHTHSLFTDPSYMMKALKLRSPDSYEQLLGLLSRYRGQNVDVEVESPKEYKNVITRSGNTIPKSTSSTDVSNTQPFPAKPRLNWQAWGDKPVKSTSSTDVSNTQPFPAKPRLNWQAWGDKPVKSTSSTDVSNTQPSPAKPRLNWQAWGDKPVKPTSSRDNNAQIVSSQKQPKNRRLGSLVNSILGNAQDVTEVSGPASTPRNPLNPPSKTR